MLNLNKNCDVESGLAIDHLIPISTNILNKTIRHFDAQVGKKVESESYGSNHLDNLVLACNKCNSHKKHRFLDKLKIKFLLRAKLNLKI